MSAFCRREKPRRVSERKRRKRKNSYLFVLFLLVLPRGCRGELHREDSLSRCLGWRWWRRRWGVEERSRSRREGESTGKRKNETDRMLLEEAEKRAREKERSHLRRCPGVPACLPCCHPAAFAANSAAGLEAAARSQRPRQSRSSSLRPSTMAPPASDSLSLLPALDCSSSRPALGSQGGEQIEEATLRLPEEEKKPLKSW